MYSFRMLVNRTYRESNREKCIQVYTCLVYESAEHEQNRKLPCNHRVLGMLEICLFVRETP